MFALVVLLSNQLNANQYTTFWINILETSWRNHTIALAGALQALTTLEQLAKTGYSKSAELETAVNSLFNTQPASAEAVYGNIGKLESGLEALERLLTQYTSPENSDLLRYVIGILQVEKTLSKKPDVLKIVANRLDVAKQQATHFGVAHENVVGNIADIYSDTISKFRYRIQVTGNFNYLQQARVANQIRTLLFAAVRAIILWRQVGGRRWQIVVNRKKLLEQCRELQREAKHLAIKH